MKNPAIKATPTNVITGFLGAGKTTLILELLKTKPAEERWAVLVNEFGEIGVDGSLFRGEHSEREDIFVKEVPGGCMCCAAGLPMQVALNQLIARARPDRLLIEPTGLGHPREVLEILSQAHFEHVINVQQTLTLVDARKLADERYASHSSFQQQVQVADVIVGTKADLYHSGDAHALLVYAAEHGKAGLGKKDTPVVFANHGKIDPALLIKRGINRSDSELEDPLAQVREQTTASTELTAGGDTQNEKQGEGYHSVGWRFGATKVFRHDALYELLSGIEAERMKAVFITDQGTFGYNFTDDALTEIPLENADESRIEIISCGPVPQIERSLLDCL